MNLKKEKENAPDLRLRYAECCYIESFRPESRRGPGSLPSLCIGRNGSYHGFGRGWSLGWLASLALYLVLVSCTGARNLEQYRRSQVSLCSLTSSLNLLMSIGPVLELLPSIVASVAIRLQFPHVSSTVSMPICFSSQQAPDIPSARAQRPCGATAGAP